MRHRDFHTWIVVALALSLPISIAIMNIAAALLTAVLLWQALAGDKIRNPSMNKAALESMLQRAPLLLLVGNGTDFIRPYY